MLKKKKCKNLSEDSWFCFFLTKHWLLCFFLKIFQSSLVIEYAMDNLYFQLSAYRNGDYNVTVCKDCERAISMYFDYSLLLG